MLLIALCGAIFGLVLSSNLDISLKSHADVQAVRSAPLPGSIYPITPEGKSPFVAVVDAVRNTVVNIRAERPEELDPSHRRWLQFWGFRWEDRLEISMGSGFFFREDGYILTNSHVISGSQRVTVTLADGTEKVAELVGEDPATDLAVLKVGGDGYAYIELGDSEAIKVGEWVVAIGNPFPAQGLDRTVTVGVVSAKGRRGLNFGQDSPEYQDYIQTDAAINPGNSGGPLVDLDGYVIGINSAIASTAGQSAGIGFAIPSNLAKTIVASLLSEGHVARGWLGVSMSDIDVDMAEANGLSKPYGIIIREVFPGSPAAEGGLEQQDIIIGYDGQEVVDSDHFRYLVAGSGEGKEAELLVQRRGEPVTLTVRIGDRDQALAQQGAVPVAEEQLPEAEDSWLGLSVAVASKALAEQYGVQLQPGLLVTYVESGSPADIKGIAPGTIIVQINHVDVRTLEDFAELKRELADRKKAIAFLGYDLRGNVRYFAVKP
ncbi:MAG: trypsin-like peptidase domain-containing protein [bacterium]